MFASDTVSAAWVATIISALDALGLDAESLCTAAGVDSSVLKKPDARIPRETMTLVWRIALHQSRDRLVGLHAGEKVTWRPNHVFPLLLFTARTVGEGIEAMVRYQQMFADTRVLSVVGRGNNRRLRVQPPLGETDQSLDFVAAASLRLLRAATGEEFRFRKVSIPHASMGPVAEYNRIFTCPVVFEAPVLELTFDEAAWTAGTRDPNPSLQAQLSLIAANSLKTQRTGGFSSSVSDGVRGILPAGDCSVDAAATALGITVRTLQRRLADEGTSYREVLEETRRRILFSCVESRCSRDDMLRLAGYPNVRALRRALERWNLDSVPVSDALPGRDLADSQSAERRSAALAETLVPLGLNKRLG